MRIGTKSLLFGAHQILIHPFIVAYCWWKLYGFPWHPYLWLCFMIHDLGYAGKKDMDGEDGAWHPLFGALVVETLTGSKKWYHFCLCHSRKMSKQFGLNVSRLCVADKLAVSYTPLWMYNRDELAEYMQHDCTENKLNWKRLVGLKTREFVEANKDTAYGPKDYC